MCEEHLRTHAKAQRAREEKRLAAGLCMACGKTATVPGGKRCASCLDVRRAVVARNDRKVKQEAIEQYGGKCECCGESRFEFLTIDHKDGDGAAHRREMNFGSVYRWLKRNGYPKDKFRLLCFNCNCARGFFGYCPHETERMEIAA